MTELEQKLLNELEEREKSEQKLFDEYQKALKQAQQVYERELKKVVEKYEQKLKEIAEKPVKIVADEELSKKLKELDEQLLVLDSKLNTLSNS